MISFGSSQAEKETVLTQTLTICDETVTGESVRRFTLDFLTDRVTVQELIRARVFQEVKDYNARQPEIFQGLVQPTDTEVELNGFRLKRPRTIDWEPQYERALDAFRENRILVLAGDEQLGELEREIVVTPETEVTFIKLVPLVGG